MRTKPSRLIWPGLALGFLGCGLLYGPFVGPNAGHCVNNPSICTGAQQCDSTTGFCIDAAGDMAGSSELGGSARPTVTGVSPTAASNSASTLITITGSNFHANPTVTVAGVACSAVNRSSASQLTCQTTPKPGTCGRQDIVVTNSDDQQSGTGAKLFTYGTTSRSFLAGLQLLATDPAPWGLVTADFDKDGNLDLVAGSLSTSYLLLWRGKGDGSFVSPPTVFNIAGNAVALASADMDQNGNPDLLVVYRYTPMNTFGLSVLLGDGAGALTQKSLTLIGSLSGLQLPGLAVADVNADTYPDVLVSNPLANTVNVFLGNASGSPTQVPGSAMVSTGPGPLVTGDFDSDGSIDFAVSCAGGIDVAKGDGKGNFGAGVATGLFTSRSGLAAYDIDGNKQLDLIYGRRNASLVAFSLGQGNLTFGTEKTLATASALPEVIRLADLDADGIPDALVTHDDTGLNKVSIFYGAAGAQFAPRVDVTTTNSRPRDAVIGDFNKDGVLDFAALQYDGSSIDTYLGKCQ